MVNLFIKLRTEELLDPSKQCQDICWSPTRERSGERILVQNGPNLGLVFVFRVL